jgi:hypothetical protein
VEMEPALETAVHDDFEIGHSEWMLNLSWSSLSPARFACEFATSPSTVPAAFSMGLYGDGVRLLAAVYGIFRQPGWYLSCAAVF